MTFVLGLTSKVCIIRVYYLGFFKRVLYYNTDNQEIARGLSNYSHQQANQLKGKKSASFASIVGFQGRAELIHADDLVIMRLLRENNEPK